MQNRMAILMATLALGGATVAQADSRGSGSRGQSDYDYARVVRVEPLARRIRVTEPRRECHYETVYDRGNYYQNASDRYYRNGERRGDVRTTNSTIVGGLLGGAIGNQIGRGEGRSIATVAGALIGAAIGHDVGQRRADERDGRTGDRYDDRYDNRRDDRYDDRNDDRYGRSREVERCRVRHEERYEERIDGYRVTYEYHGREYTSRMNYDPGRQVRVRVDVFPEQGY